jgi:hypothetical protein
MASLAVNRRMPSSQTLYYPFTNDLFTFESFRRSPVVAACARAPLFRPNTEQEDCHV